MRTSKISQETTRIFNALSPNARTTRSRGTKNLASFALGYDGSVEVKEEVAEIEGSVSVTPDIEDVFTPPRSSTKRKRGAGSPATTITSASKTEIKSVRISPRKIKQEDSDEELAEADNASPSRSRAKAKPKIPAKRSTSPNGSVTIHPPSNWLEVYSAVKTMRDRNPTAPVDTMGCEDLYWRSAPPKEKRYHTLTALMLSSQTKDTVTAVAMHRLHTELAPDLKGNLCSSSTSKQYASQLTVPNILASTPQYLDSLIAKVGFHNNKTKYIQQTAQILHEKYDDDIPPTVPELIALPGVGPKMAYLCMSAAWGIDLGIGVDVHVHRITNLWGWHTTKTPEETRAWLEGWLPKERWHEINKLLVGLGQTVCLPVGRRCGECDLAGTGLCKGEIRGWKDKRGTPDGKKVKREVKREGEWGEEVKVEAEEVMVGVKVER
jgi:endonuclease III